MAERATYLGLDVGEKRTGLAVGDSIAKIASPLRTIPTHDLSSDKIAEICEEYDIDAVVVGRPRSQSGDTSEQTEFVSSFVSAKLASLKKPIHWQDESLTSVVAEDRLKLIGKPYGKEDIDKEAASIILQDFLETL